MDLITLLNWFSNTQKLYPFCLCLILQDFVSKSWQAIIPRQSIHHVVMISNETLHKAKQSHKLLLLMKLDIVKVSLRFFYFWFQVSLNDWSYKCLDIILHFYAREVHETYGVQIFGKIGMSLVCIGCQCPRHPIIIWGGCKKFLSVNWRNENCTFMANFQMILGNSSKLREAISTMSLTRSTLWEKHWLRVCSLRQTMSRWSISLPLQCLVTSNPWIETTKRTQHFQSY